MGKRKKPQEKMVIIIHLRILCYLVFRNKNAQPSRPHPPIHHPAARKIHIHKHTHMRHVGSVMITRLVRPGLLDSPSESPGHELK